MKIQIDVRDEYRPAKGDILTYDGKFWVPSAKAEVHIEQDSNIIRLKEQVADLAKKNAELSEKVSYMASVIKELIK